MNCANCFWNQKGTCENTNWKSGNPIGNPDEPACGFLFSKTKPTSWKMIPIAKENAK